MARNFFWRQRGGPQSARRRAKKRARRSGRISCFTELGVERLEDRRMLAAGDLDPTFDIDGWVSNSFEASDNVRIAATAVQNDGKILIAGQFNNLQVIVARFNANGTLDTTFGDNDGTVGYTRFAVHGQQSFAEDIAVDNANGDIYLVGRGRNETNTQTGFAVMRLNSDGELDAEFGGGDGIVVTTFAAGTAAEARGVALQSDGKIVVAGMEPKGTGTRNDFALARYNRDGSLDTTFDGDGKLITDFNGTLSDEAIDVTIQMDGAIEKIVAVGYAERLVTSTKDFALARYNPDGSLDTTFGTLGTGMVTTPVVASDASTASAVAIDLAGNIVVAGSRSAGSNSDVAVARYSSNGILDAGSFNAVPPVDTIAGTVCINVATVDLGSAIIVQPDGKYVVSFTIQTATGTGSASYRFGLARINTNGSLDSGFGAAGIVQTPSFNEAGLATDPDIMRMVDLAMQPDGKIVAAGWIDFESTPSTQGDYLVARYDSALTINAVLGSSEVDEEAPYTLYLYSTDPGITQWTIDWGDGNIENFAGNPSSVTHTYADGTNTYAITATRTNGGGAVSAGSQNVKVKNANPSLTVDDTTIVADEGTTATNSGTFADVAADVVSVSASIGTVTQSGGVWNWSYDTLDDLVQSVSITATDEDGGVSVVTFNLEVKNVDPTLTVDNASVVAEVSQTVTNSGTYSDAGNDSVMFIASIGSVVNNGDGTWSWSYTTGVEAPEQNVTIAAIDDDFGFGRVEFSLSVDPALSVVLDQVANEGTPINITNLGTFSDIVQAGNEGWPVEIGLDANDFMAIGAFDPSSNVVFDTDTLTISGGFSGIGTTVTADTGFGNYQIAVFTFDDFELDAGLTITATGSRPIAILSQGNMSIAGTIDVSARSNGLSGPAYEQLAGPGGGNGGLSGSTVDNGDAAAGAPANSAGQYASASGSGGGAGGGAGGGFGGRGGQAETNPSGGLQNIAEVGQAFANLAAGIQGGSGGGTASSALSGTFAGGGGGGGGIELGAVGLLSVVSGGQILANGGDGQKVGNNSNDGTGGGGAGGGILLHATSVNQHGTLEAKGGNGGGAPRNGGGGGGGAILIVHNASGSFDNTGGTQSVIGGTPGAGGGGAAGQVGVVAIQGDTPAATPVIESFDYVIDWGDGSTADLGAATIDTPGVNIGDVVQGSFDGSHTYAENGVYTVTVTINDGNGGSDTKTFMVSVYNVDPALTVDQASVAVNEADTATNGGTYADVPADVVSISASVGSLIDNGDGTWSWTFDSTDGPAESQTVTITATDEDGGVSNITFDLTVDNLDPTVTVDQASVTGNEGQVVTNSGTYGDVPADTVSLTASIGTVVFSSGVWTWSHIGADELPSTTIFITATDEDGGSSEVTFDLIVNNVAPTLTVDNASVSAYEGQTASNSGAYYDVPADAVSLTASIGAVTFGSGVWNWSYSGADDLATTEVVITASDEDGGSTIATFDLTVNNMAPALTVDQASVAIDEGQVATNTGTYGDVPADTVSLSASIGTVMYSGGMWTWSYSGTDDLPATGVEITASDEDGGATVATFDLTVNNVAPSLTIDNVGVTIDEGQTAANSGMYADVATDTVSLTASIGAVVFSGGAWTWTYNATDDLTTAIVTVTATDEDGGSTIATFALTVNNVAPTVTVNSAAITVNETQIATNSGAYGDVPADTVTLTASIGAVTFAGGTWSWSYNTTDNIPATNVVITASDEDGGSTIATFSLTVNNVDPTANAGGPYFTFDDTPITLNGSGFDVAGAADPLSYAWDLDDNGTFETTGQNAVFDPQTLGFTGSQTRTVNLRVSDGDGGETIATTTVEILGVGTALIDGVLHVVGSNANDIVVVSQTNNNIRIVASFNDDNPMTFSESSVTEIQVRVRDGHDIVITTPSVTKLMTIDGGGGNDLLTGGGGRNVIFGGAGNDVIHGAAGDDVLLGGDGNDDIFGGSGNDVLVGGNGRDILNGGTGRDVAIGSQDEDTLMGGSDEDILIGGYTVHDNNVAALDAIMAIWGSAANFNSRVATLTASGGLLQANVAVFDDDDNDRIIGNAGRDLIFGDTDPLDGAIDQISLQALQDVLVAVN